MLNTTINTTNISGTQIGITADGNLVNGVVGDVRAQRRLKHQHRAFKRYASSALSMSCSGSGGTPMWCEPEQPEREPALEAASTSAIAARQHYSAPVWARLVVLSALSS